MIIVKKFIAGMLVGMLLMCGIAAAGQIAEQVDYKILVNGKQVQLTKQPVSIDDSTYLPLRATAELLGYNVGFDNGVITLNTFQVPTQQPSGQSLTMTINGEKTDITLQVKDQKVYTPLIYTMKILPITAGLDEITKATVIKGKDGNVLGQFDFSELYIYHGMTHVPLEKLANMIGGKYTTSSDNVAITY
jgi:hypothetical protein